MQTTQGPLLCSVDDRKWFDSSASISSDENHDRLWDPDEFLFNEITASKMQDFLVVKTNKHGKR